MNKTYSMIDIAPTVSTLLNVPAPAQSAGSPIEAIIADLTGVKKVALLVPDALGLFAWGLWKTEMPYLRSLHDRRSITLRSVLPSITPVNFSAMVTGTDLDGHGVQTFNHDFTCETLFDVVRKAGGKSAGIGLNGYTGSELLGRYADIWGNAGDGGDSLVEDKIIEIVEGKAPSFIIAQLGEVDDVFHQHGPSSPAVVPMLRETDARLKRLVEHLKPLGYGVIILSDHGQHDTGDPALKGSHGTDSDTDCLVPCTWI